MLQAPPANRMLLLARFTALVSGLIIVALVALFLIDNPYGSQGINTSTRAIMIGLIVLAWISMIAAWYGKVVVLLVSFVIGFVLGFYLLLTPGVFAFIGAAQLGFPLSAWLIARQGRLARR